MKKDRHYKRNVRTLEKEGWKHNDLFISTPDYEEGILDLSVCDGYEKVSYVKEEHHNDIIYKDIKRKDLLYGDWWRMMGKNRKLKYVLISTPYLYDTHSYTQILDMFFELEFRELKGFKFIFTKDKERPKYYQMHSVGFSSYDMISNLLKEKKINTSFLDQLINEFNEQSYNLNKICIQRSKNDINLTIPYKTQITYKELFENIYINKYPQSTMMYTEDDIKKLVINSKKVFTDLVDENELKPWKDCFEKIRR